MPPSSEQPNQVPNTQIQPSISIKIIRIILLVLIVIGIVLIATYQIWVPKLVDVLVQNTTIPIQSISSQNTISTSNTNNILAAIPVASSTDDGESCANGQYTSDATTLVLVQVTAASTSLNENVDNSAYSLPVKTGTELVVKKQLKNSLCAYDPITNNSGWIPVGDVVIENPQPATTPSLAQWVGDWTAWGGSYTISINSTSTGNALHAEGNGEWQGAYSTHVGQFSSDATPTAEQATFIDGNPPNPDTFDCQVIAKLVGPYLVISDNQNCGGVNVSFGGIYIKQKT